MPKKELTLRDAGRRLGLAPETVRRTIQRGDLEARRDERGRYLVARASVEAYRVERERQEVERCAKRRTTSQAKRRRYVERSVWVRCTDCRGRRRRVADAEWGRCSCGGELRRTERRRGDRTMIAVQVRRLLLACAVDAGLAEGYGPSQPAYTRWAKSCGKPTGDQLRSWLGYALRERDAIGRGWRTSWSRVVEHSGLEAWGTKRATDAELVADLGRVSELLGKGRQAPTRAEYRRHGRYDANTVVTRLLGEGGRGSWHAVAFRAGMDAPRRYRRGVRSQEMVVADYRDQCRRAGKRPGGPGIGQKRFERLVGYRIHARYGTWAEIVRAAGYVPRSRPAQFARVQTEAA